jgi:aminoglycoside phosphotransferase (APT) family kinase protein
MNPEDHLPPEFQGPSTTVSRIVAGLSGADVYRVEAAGQTFVLKVGTGNESADDWARTLEIQRRAAEAGLTPAIVHVDEPGHAVLSAFVADRSFAAFYRDPRTHEATLALLGRTVRRIHALPLAADAPRREPRAFLVQMWRQLRAGFALPDFAREAIEGVLSGAPPPREGPLVLGHNDLNPGNLVHDGTRILVLDWAAAGPMDPLYDLAVLSVFLRMNEATCRGLLSAYDERECRDLSGGFLTMRRLAASLAGAMQLHLARQMKHPGATGSETLEEALSLADFYPQMLAGTLKLGTPEGQWAFGLALLKEGLAW